jgi:ATP-dependent DNA helicase RecQ
VNPLDHFLNGTAALDLEVNDQGQVFAIGAVLGARTFRRAGRFDRQAAFIALDRFCAPAQRLLGHNLLGHDLPILQGLAPGLGLCAKPVIDTLYLSPLAFPQNPYHRLVKDYKLVRDSLNDPLADARLALRVFQDQWVAFQTQQQTHAERMALIRYCLETVPGGEGFGALFQALGAERITAGRAYDLLLKALDGAACNEQYPAIVMRYLPDRRRRMALAYAVAWIAVAGGNSVIPPWVRKRFEDVAPILRQLRDVPCHSPDCRWCRQVHDPLKQLALYFGFSAFRSKPAMPDGTGLQQEIVRHAMAEQPLLAILPTGGGKSLCYQLPALVRYRRRGLLTIVISPLQALMKDQVDNLRRKTGSPNAVALYGLLTAPERGKVLDGVRMGDVAILYVSPEQLRNHSFNEAISHREIGAWVFDEAHCLSKWGHDFRPDYLYAGRRIKEIAEEQKALMPAVQCFTATAKEDVKQEIMDYFQTNLGLTLRLFNGEAQRDNLVFEVQIVTEVEKFGRIDSLLRERLDSGVAVVYCATRRNTEAVADFLVRQGWEAAAFHAGLDVPLKRSTQELFIQGDLRVICATNAFGMGIDKDDVRLVIHADIPGSLENYVQEAGRAGRDLQEAQCVLLYDEKDVETQFRLGSHSQLSRNDIAQILRGLRAARRNRNDEVVLTSAELLRSEQVNTAFEADERGAETRVRAAIAWLERAGFIERNQNHTQVFQGAPRVNDLEAARERIARLDLSRHQQERWLAILEALMNADPDAGFSADELAQLDPFSPVDADRGRIDETPAQRVLRTLQDMTEAGLIRKSMQLTAYVRHQVKDSSPQRLAEAVRLEQALLALLREEAPDADDGQWQALSLRRLNQRMINLGFHCLPERLTTILQGLSRDGKGLAGSRGSIDLVYQGQDRLRVKLQRSWQSLSDTADRRSAVAWRILDTIMARIPADTGAGANLLLEFSAEALLDALRSDMLLAPQIKDPLAAMDRALMFLHEQQVIILQQGLAVFRSAMTIRLVPQSKGRRYSNADFEPLSQHYAERVFQVHVMNEYARRGLEKIGQALNLVAAYFSLDKAAFIQRYFPDRRDVLARATSQESFQHIVEQLGNPVQQAIVSAPTETNLLVLAGPGSGKTRVIVHRCAYLLRVLREPPQSILVLCFNHNAADQLRHRLKQLVGHEANGVTVQTYHGLAMRLTGHSMAEIAGGTEQTVDFDAILRESVSLLQGEVAFSGLDSDQLRERILAGYRHILVDEYQDIDEIQYQLVSAIAGRTLDDPDRRLGILAVGDDDQTIYRFRGARVGFIRRFRKDYQADIGYLLENYRSSGHIIDAGNQLIAHNSERMKQGHPIRINSGRSALPAGGRWQRLDPLARGRVQYLPVEDVYAQAEAVVDELKRIRQLDPGFSWGQCAVLSYHWASLNPLRALLEAEEIPLRLALPADQRPAPFRIREHQRLLNYLRDRRGGDIRLDQVQQWMMSSLPEQASGHNPWLCNLQQLLLQLQQQVGGMALPASHLEDYLCEALYAQRREHLHGEGLLLSSVHAAKGMEFPHVFLLDGGWEAGQLPEQTEDKRRLYYVGATRAKEGLYLMRRRDCLNAFADSLAGDCIHRRDRLPSTFPAHLKGLEYTIIGPRELDLSYPARFAQHHAMHRALGQLEPGSALRWQGHKHRILLYAGDLPVAALSRYGVAQWQRRLASIQRMEVFAMLRRTRLDSEEPYRAACKVSTWEVPLVAVVISRDPFT